MKILVISLFIVLGLACQLFSQSVTDEVINVKVRDFNGNSLSGIEVSTYRDPTVFNGVTDKNGVVRLAQKKGQNILSDNQLKFHDPKGLYQDINGGIYAKMLYPDQNPKSINMNNGNGFWEMYIPAVGQQLMQLRATHGGREFRDDSRSTKWEPAKVGSVVVGGNPVVLLLNSYTKGGAIMLQIPVPIPDGVGSVGVIVKDGERCGNYIYSADTDSWKFDVKKK